MGVPAAAVLDHWVNYEARFVRDGETVWPDEFWVTDRDAWDIAVRTFPPADVVMCRNCYVEDQLAAVTNVEKADRPELLYLLEPMRADWGRGTPGEFQALDYFVEHLSDLGIPADVTIRLRPHPSEESGKYESWIAGHSDLEVTLDRNQEIALSLGRASWAAGCESFAMALAAWAGLKVFCTLPPWAPKCQLPQRELIHLARLVAI
jgi:hypothetical protein